RATSASDATTKQRSRSATIRTGSSCASTAAGAAGTRVTARRAERGRGVRMARDRQRAKRRQAERRAERLEERGSTAGASRRRAEPQDDVTDEELRDEVLRDEALTDGDLHELADLEVGAPSEDIGRPDAVLRHPQPPPP